MVEFLVAHISDLHLSTNPNKYGYQHIRGFGGKLKHVLRTRFATDPSTLSGSYDERSLIPLAERLAEGFNPEKKSLENSSEQKSYDAIVISGDIATHGSLIEQSAARKLLDEILKSAIQKNEHLILPIVPGNHDRFRGKFNFPGAIDFEHVSAFDPDWSPYRRVAHTLGSRPYDKVQTFSIIKNDVTLTFISIDCALQTKKDVSGWMDYLDQGMVTTDLLKCVKLNTEKAKLNNHAVAWIVHFPPENIEKEKRLRNQELLLELAHELGVELILSGHTHKNALRKFSSDTNDINVVVAGTALAFEEPCSYRELTIGVDVITRKVSLIDAALVSRVAVPIDEQATSYVFSRSS